MGQGRGADGAGGQMERGAGGRWGGGQGGGGVLTMLPRDGVSLSTARRGARTTNGYSPNAVR